MKISIKKVNFNKKTAAVELTWAFIVYAASVAVIETSGIDRSAYFAFGLLAGAIKFKVK